MKVLVTGHDGYIGTVLVNKLLERGHEVKGIDVGYFDRCYFLDNKPKIQSTRKDIRDLGIADVHGFDVMIHLAALSNDPLGELSPNLTLEINGNQSFRLAQLAKRAGVGRFIFASSCSVYGLGETDNLTEEAPINPQSAYARSKILAEQAIRAIADGDFSPTYLRCGTVYGLSPKLRFDLVVNNLLGWAVTTSQIKILSAGNQWRPVVHVSDVASAYIAIAEAPVESIHNQAINIGSNMENYTIRNIAEVIERVVPGTTIVYANKSNIDTRSYRVDFSKLTHVLHDFRLCWTLELGVTELYALIQERGLTLDDFQSQRYTRLKQMKYLLESRVLDNSLRFTGLATEVSQ
jgi:nucleoside-diphosphate-sugar epimerase